MSGALTALRDSACRGGARDCRPLPRTPILACGRPPPLRSGRVCLDEFEHFVENQEASVASLRWCSPSARNGVQLPSGMLFSLAGIPSHLFPVEDEEGPVGREVPARPAVHALAPRPAS